MYLLNTHSTYLDRSNARNSINSGFVVITHPVVILSHKNLSKIMLYYEM